MSSEVPRIGEVDPTHVGPPDLILHEIVVPSEVPDEVRKRVEAMADTSEAAPDTVLLTASGAFPVPTPAGATHRAKWDDVTFAGRALALVEGTDQPDCDDYGDPFQWVFALSANSPVVGEAIVSTGGFARSSRQTTYVKGEPPRRGKRVSFFAAIRTEPRNV